MEESMYTKKLLAAVLSAVLAASLLTGCSAEELKAYLASWGISWGSTSSSSVSSSKSTADSRSSSSSSSSSKETEKAEEPPVEAKPDPKDPKNWSFANGTLTVPNDLEAVTSEMVKAVMAANKNAPITTVRLPDSVKTIGPNAFIGTKLTSINLDHVTTIGEGAFYGCPLTSVSLTNATTVGTSAFMSCTQLTSISLPKVTDLNARAFAACANLQKVYIGRGVTTVNANVFTGCPKLKVIYFGGNESSALSAWGWKPNETTTFSQWVKTNKGPIPQDPSKTYLICNTGSLDLNQAWPKKPLSANLNGLASRL